jgi:peptide/nickel transport system ATP-binding protein
MSGELVTLEGVSVRYPAGRAGLFGAAQHVHAVDKVSFSVRAGETLGLIGESGSGKTTIGRAILRRAPLSAGAIRFDGVDLAGLKGEALRAARRDMQLVFQDPYASLNPRMTIADTLEEPLIVHGLGGSRAERLQKVRAMLALVGLPQDAAERLPHAFSGGQRQRVGIARALILEPRFIVADEPVSALDVSIRAQIVNLLQDLQARLGVALLFIAHDLAVVRHISHRIAILYAGKLVELADRDAIYARPLHPYTEALLSAVPTPDPVAQRARRRIAITGEIPNLLQPPPGCRFASRCPIATALCRTHEPPLIEKAPGHFAACHHR